MPRRQRTLVTQGDRVAAAHIREITATRSAAKPPTSVLPVARPEVVLGLDLAMGVTGWCVLNLGQPKHHGSFELPQRRVREPLVSWLARRAEVLRQNVSMLIQRYDPDVTCYEYPDKPRSAWSGGTKGREFHAMQGLSRVEGFLVALWPQIAPDGVLAAISTSEAKVAATGRVAATKAQVKWTLMTYRGWDLSTWSDDESDAASICLAAWESCYQKPDK